MGINIVAAGPRGTWVPCVWLAGADVLYCPAGVVANTVPVRVRYRKKIDAYWAEKWMRRIDGAGYHAVAVEQSRRRVSAWRAASEVESEAAFFAGGGGA